MSQTAALPPLQSSPGPSARDDWRTIGLVGSAHAGSHFFQLVIPSLFVPLGSAFGLDFAQLGLLMTMFFVVSGLGQVASGFIVDRIGPRPVLWFGMATFVVSAVLLATAGGYGTLMLAAIVGGIGNSVFHPADFSILNHRVTPNRLGHAFSAHNLTGTLGWALSPLFVVGVAEWLGWRAAAFGVACLMAVILAGLVWGKDSLFVQGSRDMPKQSASPGESSGPGLLATLSQLLASPALWGAFLFFVCATVAFSAVQNYTIPLMGEIYGMTVVAAGTVLSGYMAGQILGMVAGGFLVNATFKSELVVFVSLIAAAAVFVLLASGWVPLAFAALAMALAGFFSGLSAPSRDMLVRKVTPKKSVGSVYGLVYSGLDVGSALGPIMFGLLLDAGMRSGPWLGAAVAFVVAALLANQIGRASRGPTAGRYATS
ncbi:MAG: MFS transporter [Burkholderiaceae bacterium]|nr:MFS transporter [Burkholderiaceae bacterium]MCD8517684.1 MFS transporter [Burkholderiaceae bacterium]MCD8536738.1 MFS transporter [Burkholderiaceae bacterium]MCD8564680.1 MFS transporter [Burkholderiaceae bacterium]